MKNNFNKLTRTLLFITLITNPFLSKAQGKTFNIVHYGADIKGGKLSTTAIQAAIDDCYKNGGGQVIVPKGRFTIGTVFLKSNVHIFMEEGAKIEGSSDLADYAEVPITTEEPQFSKCLIYAKDAENISITGVDRTSINGRGYFFKDNKMRPRLFRIENSKNIKFEDLTIANSGSWCIYFKECDSVHLNRVSVYNKENQNNDGIDIDGCSNFWVKDCNLQVEDDAICLKSSTDKICENIYVEGCTISSYHSAVKFGTASKTGFRNVNVKKCQFFECRYGTIKLLLVDGGILEDVTISDIKMYNCGGPIFIRLGNRGRTYDKSIHQVYATDSKNEGRPVGQLKNILIKNIEGHLYGRNDAVEGIMITGIPGAYIENVTLENIKFSYSGHGKLDVADKVVLEDEARYPEQSFFGVLPSYGLFARHVKNLKVKNVSMGLRSDDSRSALFLDDVLDSSFETMTVALSKDVPLVGTVKNAKNLVFNKIQIEKKGFAKGKDFKMMDAKNVIFR